MSLLIAYIREFGRFQRNAQLYLISNLLSGVSTGILLVLYNLYLLSLGYKTDFIGLVLFTGTVGAGIAIFPAGVFIDRIGGKIVLIATTLLFGVIGAAQILFRQPLPLLVSGFLGGIVTAFYLVVNAPYLTANSTPEERSHLFSLNLVVQLGTTVLGEILGGALPQWLRSLPLFMAPLPPQIQWLLATQGNVRSYQLALLGAGVIAVPSLIPLFLLSDDRPRRRDHSDVVGEGNQETRVPARGRPSHTTTRRGWIRVWEGRPLAGTLVFVKWNKSGIRMLITTPFFALLLAWILVGLGAGLFIPYFNVYFVQHLGASPALFGLIDGGANGINALLTLVAPLVAMRVGKINTVVFTRLLSIPLLLIIGFTSVLPLAALMYLFRQGTMDMAVGVFQVYSMEAVPEQRRGVANSGYQAAMQVSWAATTPIGGWLIAHVGYSPVFVSGAVFYLLAIALLWLRFGSKKKSFS